MALTLPNPSNLKAQFNTRAELAAASIPTGVNYVMAAGLTYVRDASGTALTAADGSKWSPPEWQISPVHFGAVADGATDDLTAIQAAVDWAASVADAVPIFSDDKRDYGHRVTIDGLDKTYAISDEITLAGTNRFNRICNFNLKAIGGSWATDTILGATRASGFVFNAGALASYVEYSNCTINCNNLAGGIKAAGSRTRIVGCTIDKVAGIGIECAASDVWVDRCIIGQWTTNDAEYYDPDAYTGVGLYLSESDARITSCTIRWLDRLVQIDSTNNIIQHCHMFNGMQGYNYADRDTDLNTPLDTYFGWVAGTAATTDITPRTLHTGINTGKELVDNWKEAPTALVNGASQTGTSLIVDTISATTLGYLDSGKEFSVAGVAGTYALSSQITISGNAATLTFTPSLASSPANNAAVTFVANTGSHPNKSHDSDLDNVYFDNCHHELYGNGLTFNNCKFGSKDSSSLNTSIDWWIRCHAPEDAALPKVIIRNFKTFVSSYDRYLIKFIPDNGDNWDLTTSVINTDGTYNYVDTIGGQHLADAFSASAPYTHLILSDDDPGITYRGLDSGAFVGFADDTTGATIPQVGGNGNTLRLKGSSILTGDALTDLQGGDRGAMTVSTGNSGVTSASTAADDLIVEKDGNGGITIAVPNTATANIRFADPDGSSVGMIQYDHSTDRFTITTASKLALVGIPTSSAGLSAGDVYSNSGILTIV